MGTVILDSSIVLGALDPHDALHPEASQSLTDHARAGADFCLPASVLAEVLVAESRRSQAAVVERRHVLEELFGPPRVLDADIAVAAAELRAKHRSLRLPDALVIATGITDDADVILTADKRWSGVDPRVAVLAP